MEEVSFGLLEWLKQADVGFGLPEIAWNFSANGPWPALLMACCLLGGIMTLVAGATDTVRVEKA
jgi:hypothetical protein